MEMSEAEVSSEEEEEASVSFRRLCRDEVFLRAEGLAHSGTGYSRSNCWRRRLLYSLPFTRSSFSLTRSFRRRGLEARETVRRSSSLSIHAGGWASFVSSSSSSDVGAGTTAWARLDGPESMKKS